MGILSNNRAAGPNKYTHTPRRIFDREVDRLKRKLKQYTDMQKKIRRVVMVIHGFLERSPHRNAYMDFIKACAGIEEATLESEDVISDPNYWFDIK